MRAPLNWTNPCVVSSKVLFLSIAELCHNACILGISWPPTNIRTSDCGSSTYSWKCIGRRYGFHFCLHLYPGASRSCGVNHAVDMVTLYFLLDLSWSLNLPNFIQPGNLAKFKCHRNFLVFNMYVYIILVSEHLINQLLFCYHMEKEGFGGLLLEIEVGWFLLVMYHRV